MTTSYGDSHEVSSVFESWNAYKTKHGEYEDFDQGAQDGEVFNQESLQKLMFNSHKVQILITLLKHVCHSWYYMFYLSIIQAQQIPVNPGFAD